jgi:hypothetical protein
VVIPFVSDAQKTYRKTVDKSLDIGDTISYTIVWAKTMTSEEARTILPDGRPRWSHATLANWHSCKAPTIPPTYISASGSIYWEFADGVVRGSNHWGKVSSCYWTLDGKELYLLDEKQYGCAKWEDFVDLIAEWAKQHEQLVRQREAVGAVDVKGIGGAGFTPVQVGQRLLLTREITYRHWGGWFRTVPETITGVVERITPHFLVVDGKRVAKHTVIEAFLR